MTEYKDFCPLCGSRFYGDTPEEVYNQIIKHCEDGTCEKNFSPLDVALADTGKDLNHKVNTEQGGNDMRHTHRFVAMPMTGQNAWTGKEALFGWRLECGVCYKPARAGDKVVEIKPSWWKEIVPQKRAIDYVVI